MNKTWKWILGIVLGLVVLFGVGFAVTYFFGFGHMSFRAGSAYSGHPMMDDYGFGNRGPMEGFREFHRPMVGGRGFYPLGGFFFLGGLLRLIFPLAVLAAVGYFSYKKGRKDGVATALASTPEPEHPEIPKKKSGKTPKDE